MVGRYCSRCCDDESSHANPNIEAVSHGFCNRCLRFAVWVAPEPRKTRFWLMTSLCQAGLVTRRITLKGFSSAHPPFPGFPGATQHSVISH